MKNITDDGLLVQLGLNGGEAMLNQLERIKANTKGFEEIKPHILALHDNIKNDGGFVALSSSKDYFKVKNEQNSKDVDEYIHKWASKYKVKLQKTENIETRYIIGIKKQL